MKSEWKNKGLSAFIVFTLIFTIFSFVPDDAEGNIVVRDGVTYVAHTPIRIDNNIDFADLAQAEGWNGSGSQADPWLIENYDINGTGYGYCIYIGNTTDYFVLRDSYLHEASGVESWPYYFNRGLIL